MSKWWNNLKKHLIVFLDFRKISSKILLTIISISIILPALFSLYFIKIVESRVNLYVTDRNERSVQRAKSEIELFFKNPLNLSKLISYNADFAVENLASLNGTFVNTINEFPIIEELSLYEYDSNQLVLSTNYTSSETLLDTIAIQKLNYQSQYLSKVYFKDRNQPRINVFTKVEKFGEEKGYLKSVLNLQYIWTLVADIRIGKYGEAFLISSDDKVVAHRNTRKVVERQLISTFIDKSIEFGVSSYKNENNETIFATHARIDPLDWYLVIEQKDDEANSLVKNLIEKMVVFTVLASLLALFIAILIIRKISKPIDELIYGVSVFGKGDLKHKIKLHSNDELDDLANAFNHMAHNLYLNQKKLRRIENFSLISKMVRMVSHEIRNPLNAMNINMQILKRAIMRDNAGDVQKKTKYLDIISSEMMRIDDLISNYVSLAEPPKLDFQYKSIHQILDNTIILHHAQALQNGIRIERKYSEPEVFAQIDENQFKQVLTNLILNAIQAMPSGGKLTISSRIDTVRFSVIVEDSGTGIPKNKLDEIFEFSYTSKVSGSGIGLSLSKQIIEGHHGVIRVESTEGVGSRFIIKLPLKQESKENDYE